MKARKGSRRPRPRTVERKQRTAKATEQGATPPEHQFKSVRLEIKDADKGIVEAVFATFNVKDHDGDWTLPGAFKDGAKVAIGAYGHRSWMGVPPVGRGRIRVEKKRVVLEGQFFLSTENGRETFETVKQMGELQEWSYGYDVLATGELTEELRQRGVFRVLKSLEVFEICPVLVGAGIDTETLAAKQKGETRMAEELQAEELQRLEARKVFAQHLKTRRRLQAIGCWW